MSIGRHIYCKKCGFNNQLSKLNCEKCSAILRDKVPNIDFLKVVGLLIESPNSGFRIIINADHKNYMSVLCFIFAIKMLLVYFSLGFFFNVPIPPIHLSSLIFIALTIFSFLIISFLIKFSFKLIGIRNGIRDYLATIAYSTYPIVFSLVLLSILELSVFGGFLFNHSPNIFDIKPFFAYFFIVLETLLFLWSFANLIIGINYFLKNIILSIFIGVIIYIVIIFLPIII